MVHQSALWAHPPVLGTAIFEYTLAVPASVDNLRMRFAVGIRDGALMEGENQCAFRIMVNGARIWNTIKQTSTWERFTIDLPSLSGGEGQRIRLASQIGSGLVGVLYILDEPSIGLHQRDNDKLLSTLKRLRDLGNTLIVVEPVSYTHLRAHETVLDLVCRLLLEKKKNPRFHPYHVSQIPLLVSSHT